MSVPMSVLARFLGGSQHDVIRSVSDRRAVEFMLPVESGAVRSDELPAPPRVERYERLAQSASGYYLYVYVGVR